MRAPMRFLTRTSLIFGGAALAGGVALAATNPQAVSQVIGAGPQIVEKITHIAVNPRTNNAQITFDASQCGVFAERTYNVKPGANPAEAAKYLQAECEVLQVHHQLHLLFPQHLVDVPAKDGVSKPTPGPGFDGAGWYSQLVTVSSANSVTIQGVTMQLPSDVPVITASGERHGLSDLPEGATVLVLLKGSTQGIGEGSDAQPSVASSTIQAITWLSLPVDYYYRSDGNTTLDGFAPVNKRQ